MSKVLTIQRPTESLQPPPTPPPTPVEPWEDVLNLDKPMPDGTMEGNTSRDSDYQKAARRRYAETIAQAQRDGELPPWRMRMEAAATEVCEGSSYTAAAKKNFLTASEVRRYCLKNGIRSPDVPEVQRKLISVALAYDLEKRLNLSNKAFTHLEMILDDVQTPDQMRSWANAFGILIDKRRLEEGQATMRIETLNGGAKAALQDRIKELANRTDEKDAIEADSRTLEAARPLTQKETEEHERWLPEEGTYEGTFEVIHPNQVGHRDTTSDALEPLPNEANANDFSSPRIKQGQENWDHLNDTAKAQAKEEENEIENGTLILT